MDQLALGVALAALAIACAWTALAVHRRSVVRLRVWSAAAHTNLAFGLLLVAGTAALVAIPVLLGHQGVGTGVTAGR